MQLNIVNEPREAEDYEFVVATPMSDAGDYVFYGYYENSFEAEQAAREIGGIIIHNVTIQGKRPQNKLYEIEGTFSWCCWATSAEEAAEKFKESYIEEYSFDDDIKVNLISKNS